MNKPDVNAEDNEKPPEFDVVFHNEAIVPWATVAPAGPVTFAVLNEDADVHDFIVAEIEPSRSDQVQRRPSCRGSAGCG